MSILSGNKLVGVLGLDHSLSPDDIKAEYQLDECLYLPEHQQPNQVASLRYLVLNRIYEPHAQAVLVSAMQSTGVSLIASLTTRHSIPPLVINHFLQPLPRRLIQRSSNLDVDYKDAAT